jgi:hypothetical protein
MSGDKVMSGESHHTEQWRERTDSLHKAPPYDTRTPPLNEGTIRDAMKAARENTRERSTPVCGVDSSSLRLMGRMRHRTRMLQRERQAQREGQRERYRREKRHRERDTHREREIERERN